MNLKKLILEEYKKAKKEKSILLEMPVTEAELTRTDPGTPRALRKGEEEEITKSSLKTPTPGEMPDIELPTRPKPKKASSFVKFKTDLAYEALEDLRAAGADSVRANIVIGDIISKMEEIMSTQLAQQLKTKSEEE